MGDLTVLSHNYFIKKYFEIIIKQLTFFVDCLQQNLSIKKSVVTLLKKISLSDLNKKCPHLELRLTEKN